MSDVMPVDPTITIRAETLLADPDTCKFTVSRTVHPGGPFFFDNQERAAGSPLVERLFALPGVAHVLVTENVVTVGKEPSVSWSGLKSAVGSAIRTQLLTGVPAILETPRNASSRGRVDAEVRAVVQELLDREVNHSISAHGGQISIVDVRDGNLFINEWRMPGMRGLSSDSATRVRAHGAQGRTGDRRHRRHNGPRVGNKALLQAHRVGGAQVPEALALRRPVSILGSPDGTDVPQEQRETKTTSASRLGDKSVPSRRRTSRNARLASM